MATDKSEYHRLPGKGFESEWILALTGFGNQLYMGDDHLLRVSANFFTENYRRFYFSDIQSVVISLTSRRLVWSIIQAAICALFILFFLITDDTAGRITLASIAIFFGLMFVVNVLRGPTCLTRIQTRIGTQSLPSLIRLRKAQRIMEQLKPRIQAAQGELKPEGIPQQIAASVAARPQAFKPSVPAPNYNSYRGGLHFLVFGVFLVEAGCLAMNYFSPGLLAAVLILSCSLVAAGLTIIAIVKQNNSALSTGLQVVTWAALGHIVVSLVGAYMLMVYTIVRNPKISSDQGAIFIAMSELHTSAIKTSYCILAAYALIVAVLGLITLLSSRPAAESTAEEPAQL